MVSECDQTEKEMLQLASQGDELAFTRIFHRYKHKLYSYILRLTGSQELTEDIIQDTFLKLWRNRESLADIGQFGGYLFQMTQNQSLNAFKRMAKETLILAELSRYATVSENDVSMKVDYMEVQRRLNEVVDKLPPRQKLIYTLSREQGLKHDEIAHQLNISSSTVKNHMIQVLRTLRHHLGSPDSIAGMYCLFIITSSLAE